MICQNMPKEYFSESSRNIMAYLNETSIKEKISIEKSKIVFAYNRQMAGIYSVF